jgi:LacI family transcriptional regulator
MAMRAAGLPDDLKIVAEMTEQDGHAAVSTLLAGAGRPTALICATDRIAIGAIQAAQSAGLMIGRDIVVTGHDNIHAAGVIQPALTTMQLDVRTVGETLADKLFAILDGKSEEPTGDIFPLRQILRGSTGENA